MPTTFDDTLRSLRTVSDLSRFFASMGYVEDDASLDAGWRSVARWRSFRVLATATPEPREAARSMARSLAAAARPALVAALGSGEMVLAAPRLGTAGSSRLLVVSLRFPSPFALEQLRALTPGAPPNALALGLRIADLLSGEAAGNRFYEEFRAVLDRMAHSLSPRGSAADRSLAALLTLTRVLFLYFVQARGWLDGRPDYLRSRFDTALASRRHFHRGVLHPLFFGTLNRPAALRTTAARLGEIPYLNGGLFEPHPVERRLAPVVFDNLLWRDAFDGLFERYRFCVREADEVDAIAPDMLGQVFERVMGSDERHRTGTYYTPEDLVRQIVQATLAAALGAQPGLDHEIAGALVTGGTVPVRYVEPARQALKAIRVLDPAVGSGAFLLGALECLTEAHLALADRPVPGLKWRLRRSILRENLFGVDLSPVAVRLAELRLWLAVVADDPTDRPADVAPLPNLDGIVRQGDSLLDPLGAARALGTPAAATMRAARGVKTARRALFEARGDERTRATRLLRSAEEELAAELTDAALASVRVALEDLAAAAGGRDLFGARAGLTEPQQRRFEALAHQHELLVSTAARIRDGGVPFFAFEVHCADVLERGGFNVIVGNPPWVRSERLPPEMREALKARFQWWRAAPAKGFGHLPDLSVAFLERAVELAAPGAAVGLLVPSKLASAGYGARLRHALVRETSIQYLHRVPDQVAARFGATTYPLAVVLKRSAPPPDATVALDFAGSLTVRQRALAKPGPWLLVTDAARRAIERLLAMGQPLGTVSRPSLGVKTGADDVFVGTVISAGDPCRVRFGAGEFVIEPDVLKAALRGRDVTAFDATARRVVLWGLTGSRIAASLPPRAEAYVNRHTARLRSRFDYRGGPLWTVFRTEPATAPWRVVWPDITKRPQACVLELSAQPRAVPLNSCYVAPAEDRETALVISAVLNSTWARAIVQVLADEARGGYRRCNATVAARMPLPRRPRSARKLIALAARAHSHHDVEQADLDRAVADALGLPARTRRALVDLVRDSR